VRFYDVAMTSLAIDAPLKWTDNVLSQHDVTDVVADRRGVARRLPHSALVHLALTRELHVSVGLSVRDALELALELLTQNDAASGVFEVRRGHLRISCDRSALERTLERRLREALESAPSPRRGRPRGRRTG
jgi:hypothetical protein